MLMDFETAKDATPLDPHEINGLIPSHITHRAELDRWEQDNINEALAWIEKRRPKDILNEQFMKQLHKKMFCHVWRWAGKFRQTEKNLGIPFYRISIDLKTLCDDVQYWIDHQTFEPDEIAAHFHHRLVYIHPFANGNGRHARLITDLLLENVLNQAPFTWGQANLAQEGQDRQKYIESLIAADRMDYQPLLDFVRS
jgi:Fic-DOC domain mobile mystery protein B